MIKIRLVGLSVLFTLFSLNLFSENPEVKECRLKVDGEGDFALYSISSRMIGTANVQSNKYPDLFMLGDKWYGYECFRYILVRYDQNGVPVFEQKERVTLPEASFANGTIVQNDKKIYLFWTAKGLLEYALYNSKISTFEKIGYVMLPAFEYPVQNIAVEIMDDSTVRVICSCAVKESIKAPGDWRKADYFPYDGVGRWRGTFGYSGFYAFGYPKLLEGKPTQPIQVSLKKEEILISTKSIVSIKYSTKEYGIISGSVHGGIYFFKSGTDGKFENKRHIVDDQGNVIRHPIIGATPVIYPNAKGEYVDIIASGEGGVFFYRFKGEFTHQGQPVYEKPIPLKEKNPILYGGSLITPTVVDWDYDGLLDIVSGNSAGYILFFKNVGTNLVPSFKSGVYLEANGETIHIQPGYGEDIQGPGEARWGYVGSNVFDWNKDGLWDILINDSRGRHTVFMGVDKGKLASGKPIFVDDLNLHGTWRCRPGVGVLNGEYVYITLDDDDDAHLFFREDNYNLIDGGKLHLTDGKEIHANWLEAGGKGRLRFEINDWDGDGVKDILLATNMHHSIPNAVNGIPWYRPEVMKGATLLFLKNVGNEKEPVFEYPKQIKYKNTYVRFGHHGCGASVGMVGQITNNMPNVIIGDEKGTLYLLPREYLSW